MNPKKTPMENTSRNALSHIESVVLSLRLELKDKDLVESKEREIPE